VKSFERACYGDDLTPERLVADFGISIDEAREQAARMRECMVWQNDEFEVAISKIASQFEDAPPLLHLSIKRRDKGAIHDWRKLQEIKNALVGPECEAVELYPAESRLVDAANQYHLWAFADPRFRLPFGFGERLVTDEPGGNAKQRPREA